MTDHLANLARASSDEQLLRRLQDAPEDWSAEALDAARAELRARGITWEEKPVQPARSTPWTWKLLFLLLGPVAAAVVYFLVVEGGINPRFIIAGAAATGLLGYKVIPRS